MIAWLKRFLRNEEYCETCGSRFIEATYNSGYNRNTGAPVVQHWWKCPNNDMYRPTFHYPQKYTQLGACVPKPPFPPDDKG